jgi:hypothetical protein
MQTHKIGSMAERSNAPSWKGGDSRERVQRFESSYFRHKIMMKSKLNIAAAVKATLVFLGGILLGWLFVSFTDLMSKIVLGLIFLAVVVVVWCMLYLAFANPHDL